MKKFGIPPKGKEDIKLFAFSLLKKDVSIKVGQVQGNVFSKINISLECYPDGLIVGCLALLGKGIEITII